MKLAKLSILFMLAGIASQPTYGMNAIPTCPTPTNNQVNAVLSQVHQHIGPGGEIEGLHIGGWNLQRIRVAPNTPMEQAIGNEFQPGNVQITQLTPPPPVALILNQSQMYACVATIDTPQYQNVRLIFTMPFN